MVNCIAPGIIKTDQTEDEVKSAAGDRYVGSTLVNSYGQPSDVAETALFLARSDIGYITGQTISVNGGAYFGT